jgi:hypothetical protein
MIPYKKKSLGAKVFKYTIFLHRLLCRLFKLLICCPGVSINPSWHPLLPQVKLFSRVPYNESIVPPTDSGISTQSHTDLHLYVVNPTSQSATYLRPNSALMRWRLSFKRAANPAYCSHASHCLGNTSVSKRCHVYSDIVAGTNG